MARLWNAWILAGFLACAVPVFAEPAPRLVVQKGHRGAITAAAFHPDGKTIATGGMDGTVKLWEVSTGRLLLTFPEPFGAVMGIDFTPDGRYLITGRLNAKTQIWNVRRGTLVRAFNIYGGGGNCTVDVRPDGAWFASGASGSCAVQEIPSGRVVARFKGPKRDRFWAVAFSPDGKQLAAAGDERTVYLLNMPDGSVAGRIPMDKRMMWGMSVRFHPKGDHIVVCGRRRFVEVWERAPLRKARVIASESDAPIEVVLSPDGRRLAVGREDGTIVLHNFGDGKVLRRFKGHSDWVRALAFAPDGKSLFSGGHRGGAHLWDLETGKRLRSLAGKTETPLALTATADGGVLIARRVGERLQAWDVVRDRVLWTSKGEVPEPVRAAFAPGGSHVAFAPRRKPIQVRSLADGAAVLFPGNPTARGPFALGPGGRHLANRVQMDEVAVWKRGQTQRLQTLPGDQYTDVLGLAFTPDGSRVVMGGKGNHVWVLDVATKKRVLHHYKGAGWVSSFGFHPDGATLACGGPYSAITLRRSADLEAIRTLEGHRGSVPAVAFSKAGDRLISVGAEGLARIWDPGTGRELGRLQLLQGGEWVLLDGVGRYDASAGAAAFCSWIVETKAGLASLPLEAVDRRRKGLALELLPPPKR